FRTRLVADDRAPRKRMVGHPASGTKHARERAGDGCVESGLGFWGASHSYSPCIFTQATTFLTSLRLAFAAPQRPWARVQGLAGSVLTGNPVRQCRAAPGGWTALAASSGSGRTVRVAVLVTPPRASLRW